MSAASDAWRARRKAEGGCMGCAKGRAQDGFASCRDCRAAVRRRRDPGVDIAEVQSEGRCQRCGLLLPHASCIPSTADQADVSRYDWSW